MSRILPLDEVRADGWFERLGDDAPHFGELCNAVGERVVAFAIVAGVRISAVALDPRMRDASVITFNVGDETEEHQLPLGELRRRLAATLVADEPFPESLSEAPSVEEIQRFIGFRYLLLAPIFGVTLRELHLEDDASPGILVDLGAAADVVPLDELRDLIRQRVRAEAQESHSSPFAIDLQIIPEALAASARGDWSRTVELLGTWPGPLSVLHRTREGAELSTEVKGTLAEALGVLGTAYVNLGNFDWAEEVLRLAIQWGQDLGGTSVGVLFRRLGHAHMLRGRFGQAVGLLRRAVSLGADRADVLPLLAESFARIGHHLPAMLYAEQAVAHGAEAASLEAITQRSREALGETWTTFRERVPRS
ncbi:MAG: hypothetical protein AAGE52_26595 [Myxococcota bacterium]